MIAMTIEAAQQSDLFDRIVVSTDDQRIADVATAYGVEVPFHRTEHADDFVSWIFRSVAFNLVGAGREII